MENIQIHEWMDPQIWCKMHHLDPSNEHRVRGPASSFEIVALSSGAFLQAEIHMSCRVCYAERTWHANLTLKNWFFKELVLT